ncbi:hypothetical protein COJ85_03945 [Bacillus sp. AFS076308]|uniref:hypothetical protein n=1 Tax=unclassified Bacillus (in: firmicutes) TaxID=185979 RepID=UPI000BF97B6F|nr:MULTISPECIES: hypothetical protein [unclassified Bacillus (in: firmicutes)]PFO08400.1 hypothetical protein COJ85_03945 [Bacillus sp. AFS076308]PGV50591.1 hypothetical protein COD92_16745 [Bacillus sp. AFS037270]
MNKNLISFSIIFLGLCIVLSSWFISQSLKSFQNNEDKVKRDDPFRYELISPNESNIIIFDKQSGDYWRKYIEPNEGPTDWEKQQSPVSSGTN